MHLHISTPLYRSFLHSNSSRSIYYKMESAQPSGSFKLRGIGLLCSKMAEQGIKKFVIASGGNAGLAVAYSGYRLGIETTVLVPESTSETMRKKIREMGANLEIKGKNWNEAHEYALKLSEEKDCFYVHPYDHPLLWEGHASMVEELAAEIPEPEFIVLSVGGGGLFCGLMLGLEKVGWNETKVICAETFGAASMAASLKQGKLITLDSINSIATSLGAKRIAEKAWEFAQERRVTSFLCSDNDALLACRNFLDEYRVLTEPACGASLAALNSPELQNAKSVVFIVCGGASMSLEDMLNWEKTI